LTSVNTSPGNITISTNMNLPSGISVRADRVRLRQVVINLLTNAIKYNRPGGTVTVHGEMVDDNMVRITIADTGIGIPKAYQSEIFTPFNRLGHENSTIDGSGIGLAITRRLVQMMQGHIDFSSDKTGTRFWVELPAGRAGAVVEPGFHNEGLQLDTRTLSGCRILYIEDNPSNVALITNLLHKLDAGIGIDSCATAERGIQMADSADYDLIFMDINLPGMSGIEALKRLENGRRKCPPVVAITADVSAPTMRQVEQGNFCGILTKPINITETIKLIEQNV
jgi:CheY-like chemotaxis protein